MVATNDKSKRAEERQEFRALLRSEIQEAVSESLLDITNASKQFDARLTAFGQAQEDRDKAMRTHALPGAEDETHSGEGYSLGKVYAGILTGDYEKWCPMEKTMSDELFAMGTVPDTAGGFLVPTEVFESQIIPLLRPQVIVLGLGITTLPITGAGTVEIPREVTGPTVANVAENAATTDSDLAFGNHELRPKTSQSYIKASRRFLQLGVGADQFIRSRMAEELALQWNRGVLKGTGANGDPLGIYNTPGVNTIDFTSSAVSGGRVDPLFYKKLLAMEDALADANALTGATSLGFALANKAFRACRQIESDNNSAGTSNLEMGRKVFSAGNEDRILGYNHAQTTQLAQGTDTEIIFGDWSKAILATWGNLSIEASNVASDALAKRQTHIVAYIDYDVAVTQPTAFAISSNLNTSSI